MAQQSIVNVESQVGQSVVDSTTDVDVSRTTSSATSGGITEEIRTETSTHDPVTTKLAKEGTEREENVNPDSNKTIELSRTQTPGVAGDSVDSDIDIGSGVGSPMKSTGVEGSAKPAMKTSVKKLQSFKAVSINKHFLEKASAGANNMPTKTVFGSERLSSLSPQTTASSPATLSFAKPRLVAKSSSGIRDSSPGGLGSSASAGAKNAAEAQRAVWNKNQPPPVVPAKEMTDEELKKTYGIHLASRLQTEDAGKESTWADEDDDEDWVPETIEWNDGTKVALQVEPTTPTPTAAVPATIISSTSVPLVRRDGERESSQKASEKQNEPKTLVFTRDANKSIDKSEKGIKEAPPPRASPWATLPPPNTVPLSAPRSESRASDFGGSQHTLGSREVHVDDFNRPWRDRPMNNQLYNSQTGQLEPVQDRNRVLRNPRAELQLGKTQVLQRPPSQLSGPAEPSPAFQQTRTGVYRQDDHRRRRTSSNVSGGSGSTGRRLSFMYGPEHVVSPEEAAYSPRHLFSAAPPMQPDPQLSHVANGPLTSSSATMPINETFVAPSEDFEDPIAKQQRIMKETRDLARKRKQEEEAKEEAAKKERLRLKLEALERDAEAKAAKATAEANKAAAAEVKETAVVQSTEVTRQVAPSMTSDARSNQNGSDGTNITSNVKLPNPPNHNLSISQEPPSTDTIGNSLNPPVSHQPPPQHQSLSSVPYRPGSFGNRSPTKKFSTLQPSSQSPIPPTNSYNMVIRDPRYDPTLTGRYNSETLRWTQPKSSRASPYGSIGDKSKPSASNDTRSSVSAEQQPPARLQSGPEEIPPPAVEAPQSQPDGFEATPKSTEEASPLKMDPRQAMSPAKNSGTALHATPTVSKGFHNPWASYPDQLQRDEQRERQIAREHRKPFSGFGVSRHALGEEWTPRSEEDKDRPEPIETIIHNRAGAASGQHQPTLASLPTSDINEGVTVSKPPSPPPPEFCPVTALDFNSDEDSQKGRPGVQHKRLTPCVRLPPPPRTVDILSMPTSGSYHRQEPPRSPDVTRYDRVLGDILKTIEVSKGHQSSPSMSSPAPLKFSETKPVYTDDRESQQHSATTVSLPSMSDHALSPAEPEDLCTNVEQDFLQRLYVQEFGSQPTVRIPTVIQNGTFSPARPIASKAKKPARPKGFAETVHPFEVVGVDDLVNEQGCPFIPVRIPPNSETKNVVITSWPKPLRRESKKTANFSNNNNNNRRAGGNSGYYKKDTKPFMNQRQQMQSPSGPKPTQAHAWERQHTVVQ